MAVPPSLAVLDSLAARIPYLGLCLGGQLLAEVAAGRVVSNRWEELGALPVHLTVAGRTSPLFRGISSPFITFQWHHDSFDIPADGVLLASSPACRHQAFRIGSAAWGAQFHPEVTEEIIRAWCAWDPETSSRVDQLVADFHAMETSYCSTAQKILLNFLGTSGLVPTV